MPVFPIKFAESMPSGKGQNVESGNLPDTGAGQVWGQVAKAGAGIAEIGFDIQQKQIELAKKAKAEQQHLAAAEDQFKMEEIMSAAVDSFATGPAHELTASGAGSDTAASLPASGMNLEDLSGSESGGVQGSTIPQVDQEVTAMMDPEQSPVFQQAVKDLQATARTPQSKIIAEHSIRQLYAHFRREQIVKVAKDNKDKFNTLYPKALADGNVDMAKNMIASAIVRGTVSESEGREMFSNIPFDMPYAMSEKALANGDYDTAIKLTEGLKAENTKQSQKLITLKGHLNTLQTAKRADDAKATDSAYMKINLGAVEDSQLPREQDKINALTARQNELGLVPGGDREKWQSSYNFIEALKTREAKPDSDTEATGYRMGLALSKYSSQTEFDAFDKWVDDNKGKLGTSMVPLAKLGAERRQAESAHALPAAINTLVSNGVIPAQHVAPFMRGEVAKYANDKRSQADILADIASDYSVFAAANPTKLKEPDHVSKVLGELKNKGTVTPFGIVREFSDGESAVAHARSELGIDFEKDYPRAVEVINENWPGTIKNAPPPASQPAAPKPQEGQTATNKATGRRLIYRAGKWEPMQ